MSTKTSNQFGLARDISYYLETYHINATAEVEGNLVRVTGCGRSELCEPRVLLALIHSCTVDDFEVYKSHGWGNFELISYSPDSKFWGLVDWTLAAMPIVKPAPRRRRTRSTV